MVARGLEWRKKGGTEAGGIGAGRPGTTRWRTSQPPGFTWSVQDKVTVKATMAAEVVARAYTGTPMAAAIEEKAEQTGISTIRAERAGRDDKR